jgi:hypothetical protein
MSGTVVLTFNLSEEERKKAELEARIAELERELELVRKRIEAAPLFMRDAPTPNGTAHVMRPQSAQLEIKGGVVTPQKAGDGSLPQMVLGLVRLKGPLTTIQIRDSLLAAGFPREKLGATYSYLYTVLSRLVSRKRLERSGDRYRLPRGAMAAAPEEAQTAT